MGEGYSLRDYGNNWSAGPTEKAALIGLARSFRLGEDVISEIVRMVAAAERMPSGQSPIMRRRQSDRLRGGNEESEPAANVAAI